MSVWQPMVYTKKKGAFFSEIETDETMRKIKRQKALRLVGVLTASVVILTALMPGPMANAVLVVGPQTDPNKTVTMNSDGSFSCGPGYTPKASGTGCEAK